MSKKITIFDTTLRDGEQVPGAKLNTVEKVTIAKQLEKLGVDVIEAGFPISSPEDFKAVQEVAATITKATVCALSRGKEADIDHAWNAIQTAKNKRIHTFLPTSETQLKNILRKSQSEVLKMTERVVKHAKSYHHDVEFSLMDASRTDFNYIVEVIRAAIENGATTINIPDTVGYALPEEWSELISNLIEEVPEFKKNIVLSVHMHNDLGFATANTLSSVYHGARQIEVTINGIGERAGNCALEEVVMALRTRSGKDYHTNIEPREIYKTSRLVSQMMKISVQPNKAIVGANAFAHSSGIHQDGVIKKRENFEIINPQDVGFEQSQIILTARSGRAALLHRLNKLGYNKITKENIEPYYEKFLSIADLKKEVYDDDLHLIISETIGQGQKKHFLLDLVQVLCGNKNIPMANVQIKDRKSKKIITGTATGTGPIDAAYKAVNQALNGSHVIKLKEFLVQAITEGMDAQGKVIVQVDINGISTIGYGANADIIVASTEAYIDAVNRYYVITGEA